MHMAASRDLTRNGDIGADTYSALARTGTSHAPTGANGSTTHATSPRHESRPTGALSADGISTTDQTSATTGISRSTTTMLTSGRHFDSNLHDGLHADTCAAGVGSAIVNGSILVQDRSKTVRQPTGFLTSASPGRVNGSESNSFSPPKAKPQEYRGSVTRHKRTATGEFKPSSNTMPLGHSTVNHATRPRSKTTSSMDPSGRIAELSVQLRARLSYAASKVEKSRPARDMSSKRSVVLDQSVSPISTEIPSVMGEEARLQTVPEAHAMRPLRGERPSLSTTPPPPTLHSQGASTRLHPTNSYDVALLHSVSLSPRKTLASPPFTAHMPKLAPPVDIVARSHSARRRRPNPNQISPGMNASESYRGHRRHQSQQEYTSSTSVPASQIVLVPGTPPLRPSPHPASARSATMDNRYLKPRTNSQNALMEQDAIETLLFMSSPENSGYHPSPQRHSNPASVVTNNDVGQFDDRSGVASNSEQSSQHFKSQESYQDLRRLQPAAMSSRMISLEAHAGDEIDRLLDQMDDPDSEDERRYSTFRVNKPSPNVYTGSRADNVGLFRGHAT